MNDNEVIENEIDNDEDIDEDIDENEIYEAIENFHQWLAGNEELEY